MSEEESALVAYPAQEEVQAAQRVCCGTVCSACESLVEYAWRRRDIDLAALLQLAIERELTPAQRELTVQHWLEGVSVNELAAQRGITPGTVSRQLKKSQDRLHRVLFYAVQYQQNLREGEAPLPLSVQRARAILAARRCAPERFSERLKNQRLTCNFSLKQAAGALEMPQKRLLALEEDRREPTLREAVALAAFYGIELAEYMKGSEKADAGKKRKGTLAYGAFPGIRPRGAAAERSDCGCAQALSDAAG